MKKFKKFIAEAPISDDEEFNKEMLKHEPIKDGSDKYSSFKFESFITL